MRFSTIKFPNWNLMIKESSSNSKWQQVFSHYHEMQKNGFQVTDHTLLPCIFKACSRLSFNHGTTMHGCLIKQGLEFFTSVGNSILDFYMKSDVLHSALMVFDEMPTRDSVSWNIMIHGHIDHGDLEKGLAWFSRARVDGFEPNVSALVLVIHACRNLGDVFQGRKIHGYIIRSGFSDVVSVQNSLLSMHADIDMRCARILFDEMFDRDVISWSAMIGGHVRNEEVLEALRLFRGMMATTSTKIEPDGVIIVSVLKACTISGNINVGKLVHKLVICRGFFSCDVFVGNALVDMYSKYNDIDSAYQVFNEMPQKNIVSWNSLLSGLIKNQKYIESISLVDSMGHEGIEADEVTLVSLLQSCKYFMNLIQCKLVHAKVIRKSYELNELVMNSLIGTYAKCSHVEFAWKIFIRMRRRDMVSWSTMIAGFTHCGKPDNAIAVFNEMNRIEINPNAITILSILEACSMLAEINKSKWAHGVAIRRGLIAQVEVGTAVLDMYSKCGDIIASKKIFDQILEKNIFSWSAMIAAYGMNGLTHDALASFTEMTLQGLKPNSVTLLSVLSACSHGGLVEEGLSIFTKMAHEYGIEPKLEHYSCIVDMFCRAGKLNFAIDLMNKIPENLKNGASIWGALLSACRSFKNSDLGVKAVSRVLELEPSNSGSYLLASSMYASSGLWEDAAKMRCLANDGNRRVIAGYSLVHVDNNSHRFVAGDDFHSRTKEIYAAVRQLHGCMKVNEDDIVACK